MIIEDQLDKLIGTCHNFYWKEALMLRDWGIYCVPTVDQYGMILQMAQKMQEVRYLLGAPIHVTSWLRPQRYNEQIGGAKKSYHMTGGAVDFQCRAYTCDQVREKLKPHLEELKLRMEDLPLSRWVHLDMKPVKKWGKRFFKP